jgi:1,2-diacylglycerol 3-beta-galactosyltransferase
MFLVETIHVLMIVSDSTYKKIGFNYYILFNKIIRVDKCFVPSDALYKCARDRNVQPDQIVQLGLPIRKGFWATSSSKTSKAPNKGFFSMLESLTGGGDQKTSTKSSDDTKSKFRNQLGLLDNIPTVLVVGGGDGMGGIIQQAKALGEKLNEKAESTKVEPDYQMVVVCGKNQNAQDVLSATEWGNGVNVVVNGFVNNMDEWMRASDVIVTKAGPGTIAEASICGLPCMLSSYL